KLSPASQKVGFAVHGQRSRLLVRLYSVGDHHQVRAVQIRRKVQARCAEVKDLNIRAAFIFAAKPFDHQWTKAVIAHEHIPQPYDAYTRRNWQYRASPEWLRPRLHGIPPHAARIGACAHKTFTLAISRPLASSV